VYRGREEPDHTGHEQDRTNPLQFRPAHDRRRSEKNAAGGGHPEWNTRHDMSIDGGRIALKGR